jgi:ABC-type amino acid transport substrate-binding protein
VKDTVKAYVADASATYTAAGVKAILEYKDTDELYEILPNYLYRTGIDVFWRTSNWGEPPVHVRSYETIGDLRKRLPETSGKYDGDLLVGLKDEILAGGKDQVFGVLHTYTNHGPSYNTNYPPEFEVFTPVSSTVEMSKVSREELFNAYDNSIVYTDWIVHSVIDIVRELREYGIDPVIADPEADSEEARKLYGVEFSDINSIKDLEGRKVGTGEGSLMADILSAYIKENDSTIEVVYSTDLVADLVSGRIEAIIFPGRQVDLYNASYDDLKFKAVGDPVVGSDGCMKDSNAYWYFRKTDEDVETTKFEQ